MKNLPTFEDFVNEAREASPVKDNYRHDGFIYKNHNYTMGLVIDRKFFDNDPKFFNKERSSRKGIDWNGVEEKINKNRHTEKQGNFAKALWDDDNYVIVGAVHQSDHYLSKLNSHLNKEYKDYKSDIVKNFSFNAKGEVVLGDEFMVNGKIH